MNESESSTTEPISRLRGWYLAARPATLPAAVVPVLVGAALALSARQFNILIFLATMACSLLIQIGTNFANDYYDFRKGADTG
jgi:1,4-dihydroxy-2-naphthoate octaprenyltransferase